MSYTSPRDTSRQLTGFFAVILLHLVLVYALVHGLARKIVEVVLPPLETKIIEEVKPPPLDKPPPPPPPKLAAPPPPFIPPPEVQIQVPQTAPTISAVTTVAPTDPVPLVPLAAPRAPTRVGAVVDARSCQKPPYPAASLRAGETGIVLLSFLIDVDGSVLDSKIERSSGYRRLDEAARDGLKLCRFRAATVDGKPEKTWSRMEYSWKLE